MNQSNSAKWISGMFQYYAKVVPTEYASASGYVTLTNQFSVMKHYRTIEGVSNTALPGVFFFYEISPIRLKITSTRPSFGHFVTMLCAIIGGVYTVVACTCEHIFQIG